MSKEEKKNIETETVSDVTEKTTETVEEKKTVSKTKATKAEPLMYVGPTITGVAIQNAVYSAIPETADKMLEDLPEFRNLFIKIEEYPKANKMLREQNGYIYRAFTKAFSLSQKGGN